MALTAVTLNRLSRALAGDGAGRAGRGEPGSRARRRARGVFFTPAPLVQFVVRETLGARLHAAPPAWRDDGSPELTVLDPAAGDGRFLAAAVDYLVARSIARGFDEESARPAIERRCVVGIERDPELAAVARAAIGSGATVHCAEALLGDPLGEQAVDVVVGNPPYVRSVRFSGRDRGLRLALRGRYAATSHGEWDLYAAFIEQSLHWTRGPAEIGLVVPSRWWTSRCAEPLRERLSRERAVRALVDFGAEQVFADATTYASVVFLSRRGASRLSVARRREGDWDVGSLSASELDGRPWRLSVGRRRAVLDQLASSSISLSSVARIAKGAGTSADAVYLVGSSEASVESALLRTVLRGRDVRAFGRADPSVRCLVPYDRDGNLLAPERLRRDYPGAFDYLVSRREQLDAREGGRFAGPTFYRFGRPQNMAFLASKEAKVVVPDVTREGRALIDDTGAMVLDSAYALRPLVGRDPVLLSLVLAVLNSRAVMIWLGETGLPLRGGYRRIKTAYLSGLPLPAQSHWAERAAQCARRDKVDPEEVDELVRRAYGVLRADWGT